MDPFLISLIAKTGYDWWKSTQDDKKQQQYVDTQNATNAGQLKYMYDAMEQEKVARQEAMRLQQSMFEKSLAEQQRGTDMLALYAKGAMGMNLAGTLQQQQANLDQQIKLAQMQQAQTQPQRMAQASAMQSLPMLQRLMGMTPYKLPTSTVENDYSTLGQNVLGDYFKTLQATQPFIEQMMPQQASSSTTNPHSVQPSDFTSQYGPNPFPAGSDVAAMHDSRVREMTIEDYKMATQKQQLIAQGITSGPAWDKITAYEQSKGFSLPSYGQTQPQQPGSTNQGITVGGVAQRAPQIDIEAPQVSQDNQAMYMGQPMGPAIGNLTMPAQRTNSPTTVLTLPDGTAFVMPVNGVDQNVTSVTNTGQPVSYSPVIGAQPGVPTAGGANTVPTPFNPQVPNLSTTGSPYGPATTTNPLEVDTALMNKPVSELIQSSPLYQYQSKENEDAIRRMMAQRGLLNSSHTLSATSKAAQALSANEADKQVGRLSAMYNAALGQPINMPTTNGFQLSNMGNTGQGMSELYSIYNNAANNRAQSYSNFGNTMGNAMTNAGTSGAQNWANYGRAVGQANSFNNLNSYGRGNNGMDWGQTLMSIGNYYNWGQPKTTAPANNGSSVGSAFNNLLSGFGSLFGG